MLAADVGRLRLPDEDDAESAARLVKERQALIVGLLREVAACSGAAPESLFQQLAALQQRGILDKTVVDALGLAPLERPFQPPPAPAPTKYARDFEDLGSLGRGAFGRVRRARHRVDRAIYAVKRVTVQCGESAAKYEREMRNLARLSHAHVIRYYGAWVEAGTEAPESARSPAAIGGSVGGSSAWSTPSAWSATSASEASAAGDELTTWSAGSDAALRLRSDVPSWSPPQFVELCLQMELCGERTLRDWIEHANHVAPIALRGGAALKALFQVASALRHIHAHDIMHRDVKPENLLLRERGVVVLDEGDDADAPDVVVADFGLSKDFASERKEDSPLQRTHTGGVGTASYAAPEQCAGGTKYGPAADVFALGLVALEMAVPLCTAMERAKTFEGVRAGRFRFPEALRKDFSDLVRAATQVRASDRPSAHAVADKARRIQTATDGVEDLSKQQLVEEVRRLRRQLSERD